MKLTILASRNIFKIRFPGVRLYRSISLDPICSKILKTGDQIEAEKLEKRIHHSIIELIKKREDQVMNGEGNYLSLIINESLRLYPPVLTMSRKIEKEVRWRNLNLPANMNLLISSLALHHDPEIWGEDVHLFKPERFSEGVANATKDNIAAFLPFGMGPRTCVGFNFAINEAKIALTMILQCYTFTLSPAYVHLPVQILTNHPRYGVQVMLHPL
ncbi:Cytochrome P450, E-class, group IV [Trema orientale]|uniref:Cytochrome P450, E-class, group IV n=1 Tax=Trema orientale TaxID=63057 RepID=A0A2P5FHI9_TREOI|nr:Cytochrome P450, E-class, group IV [Trema orientale]